VIAYLVRMQNMSLNAAYTFVRGKRACIYPNAGFVRQLQVWAKRYEDGINSMAIGSPQPSLVLSDATSSPSDVTL
jgi:Dual specificity phosphatase, catalytic domain